MYLLRVCSKLGPKGHPWMFYKPQPQTHLRASVLIGCSVNTWNALLENLVAIT